MQLIKFYLAILVSGVIVLQLLRSCSLMSDSISSIESSITVKGTGDNYYSQRMYIVFKLYN